MARAKAEPNIIPSSDWRRAFDWLTQTAADDPEQAQRGRLAAAVLLVGWLVIAVPWVAAMLAALDPARSGPFWTMPRLLGLALACLWGGIYWVNRRGWVAAAGVAMSVLLLAANLVLIAAAGPLAPTAATLVLPVIAAGLFGPPLSAVLVAALGGLAYLALNLHADPAYFASMGANGPALPTVLIYLNLTIVGVVAWLFSRTARHALRERHQLSLALVDQRQQLMARLEVQTRQLRATIAVAHAIAGERDLDRLLDEAVRLLRDSFGYYHVQVFLVDEEQNYAVLRQSTGEVGQRLLTSGHRLPVGSLSVIGQVTASGRPVVARDTDTDPVHRRNELLPDTRSELALPLTIGDRLIGALDLQSVEPDAFDESIIPTLRALADQLAVAIENARLFEQAETSLREMRDLSQEMAHRSWAEFLGELRERERRRIVGAEPPELQVQRSHVMERVLGAGTVIVSSGEDGQPAFMAAPIVIRHQVVGVLGVEPDGTRRWTQDDLQIMQSIAERTALAIENARLYIEARRAAERERMLGQMAERLQRAPSLALLLESAARELASALGTDNVYAEISLEQPLAEQRRTVSGQAEGTLQVGPGVDGEAEEVRAEG